jgi:hypothetical protein
MGRKRLSSSDSTTTITSNCTSKLNNSNSGGGMQQRNAANARERARMRVLSKAFIKLKTHLPWVCHYLSFLFMLFYNFLNRFHMIRNYQNLIHFV